MARRDRVTPPGRDPFDPLDGRIDHQLDLHTFTAVEARTRLRAYVEQTRRRSPGALVHVITGRGRNSPGAPVLKPLVRTLLRGELAPHVAAWGLDLGEGGYLIRLRD